MKSLKNICIAGGGIAGLSAAVFLANENYNITLIEASPKIGGRTYSFFDNLLGGYTDNGQHILAGWYHNTFEFLHIIGSFEKLSFQNQLEVKFKDDKAKEYLLKCSELPPPFHLLGGIMKYNTLRFKDKTSLLRLIYKIRKMSNDELKEINADELFRITLQSERLINYFWKPFIVAVFNARPENTSAYLFAEVIKTGFFRRKASNLVLPDDFLNRLFNEPAVEFLKRNKCKIITNKRIVKINFNKEIVTSLTAEDNSEIKCDYYISAVPFFEFSRLTTENVFNNNYNTDRLKPSPIVNIHIKFDGNVDEVINTRFIGLLNTNIQWVFRVGHNQVCIVVSSADEIASLDKQRITEIALNELKMCIPEFKDFKVTGVRVIKEMKATFIPDKFSLRCRPPNKTKFNNFFVAGDWTDTGLPATIESAVKSARNVTKLITNS